MPDLRSMQLWLNSTPEEIDQRYVSYWPRGWAHGHSYSGALDESMEDIAEGLAQSIMDCNPDKHNGHGSYHANGAAQDAYFEAISQLVNSEDKKAYKELRRNVRHFIKWSGPAPEVVFTPNKHDPDKWDAVVKHPETGDATLYETRSDLGMPSPGDIGATPNPSGPGFVTGGKKRKRSS